jgi:hypothetical protein
MLGLQMISPGCRSAHPGYACYVSSIERKERNVSIDNGARIAKALAVETWKFAERWVSAGKRYDL